MQNTSNPAVIHHFEFNKVDKIQTSPADFSRLICPLQKKRTSPYKSGCSAFFSKDKNFARIVNDDPGNPNARDKSSRHALRNLNRKANEKLIKKKEAKKINKLKEDFKAVGKVNLKTFLFFSPKKAVAV